MGRFMKQKRMAHSGQSLTDSSRLTKILRSSRAYLSAVLLVLSFVLLLAQLSPASEVLSADSEAAAAVTMSKEGDLVQAVTRWLTAARLYGEQGKIAEQIDALIKASAAYQAVGQYEDARTTLESALPLAKKSGERAYISLVLAALGNLYIASGPAGTANDYLTEALALAREEKNIPLSAFILNNIGNLRSSEGKYSAALGAYRESVELASQVSNLLLAGTAMVNAAIVSTRDGKYQESETLLDTALKRLQNVELSQEKLYALINLGVAYDALRTHLPKSNQALLLKAFDVFNQAGKLAESGGNRRAASYAFGHLSALYYDERRYEEALELANRAGFAAQQINALESLYRWQWQAGRSLRALGRFEEAIGAYRRAVSTVQAIRPELLASFGQQHASFRESVGQVYFELVDLLLQRARSVQEPEETKAALVEAREIVESFKVAELRDYFRDDCVDTALSKVTNLDEVAKTAAIVYPILLPDRIELLVTLPTALKRFSVPVGLSQLTEEVRAFRRKLEKRTTREYLPHAQKLFAWLIRPMEADLDSSKIDTLVFVPDGPLRTIPMAALHDGKQFLIAKYAVATTPGLRLTDPHPIDREKAKVLIVGVSEPVQGFAPLPYVSEEIRAVQTLFESKILTNEKVVVSNLEADLQDKELTILHLASHGQFAGDVDKTFILTFNDKLTMDRLERLVGVFKFRDVPLELITLSACETAAGDDRAALGLAGIAVKAGARSALATLWFINDEATSNLVVEFYRQLQNPSVSRATALRRAQLQLLNDRRYTHPGYWSPFLLINNWL